MTVRSILIYPDTRLNTVAKEVTVFDHQLEELVQDMKDTMYSKEGIGLAASQIDVHLRMIVADVSEERNNFQIFINPKIVSTSTDTNNYSEGCLSVPGIYEEVNRPATVRLEAQDVHGKTFSLDAEGLLATCLQHEIDHLNGIVFVQKLSFLKQSRIRSKLRKQAKAA